MLIAMLVVNVAELDCTVIVAFTEVIAKLKPVYYFFGPLSISIIPLSIF